jgi:hypothetical protein
MSPLLHLNVSKPLPLQHFTIFVSALLYTGKHTFFAPPPPKKVMMKYYQNRSANFNMFWKYGTAVRIVVVILEMMLVDNI